MKTFVLLFCTAVFSFSNTKIFSQDVKIIVKEDQTVTVGDVFRMLKKQTPYTFIYEEDLFKKSPLVLLKKGEISANKLLAKSVKSTDFDLLYSDKTRTLVIRKKSEEPIAFQDSYLVSGTITDFNGVPIFGVTVIYKEFPVKATATDFDGKYQILIDKDKTATLQFSSVGFKTQEVLVRGRKTIDVVLQQQTTILEETVIVGYGTQKRGEVSSAISTVKPKKILENMGSNASFDRGLAGLIKGVYILQGDGRPGSGVDINIRGITSPFIGSDNNPLFVIDGVPFQTNIFGIPNSNDVVVQIPNPLLSLNPNDIESVDVLKDASATAIYGSRGANGVIIISTKKGKQRQKTQVTFSSTSTFAQPIGKLNYLNATQYKARAATILENSATFANINPIGLSPNLVSTYNYMADISVNSNGVSYNGLRDSWFGNADTNWADLIYRDQAYTQQYNTTITGGSEKTAFGITAGHTNQEGLLPEDKYKQYNFRTSIDTKINDIISTGFSINLTYVQNKTGYNDNNGQQSLNSQILTARPDINPLDEFGNFNRLPQAPDNNNSPREFASPLALTRGHDFNDESLFVLGNAYLEIRPFKNIRNFKIRSDVNMGRYSTDTNRYTPATIVGNFRPFSGLLAASSESTLNNTTVINSNLITNLNAEYNFTLEDKHDVSALVGYTWDRSFRNGSFESYNGFPDDNTLTTSSSATTFVSAGANEAESGLNSVLSRLSYNYDERYFVTFNFRRDKSSKFGPDNKNAYFPSIAASWSITNESFLRTSSNIVNNLRLRMGYGRVGSVNLPDFNYVQFWDTGTRTLGDSFYNGTAAVGLNERLPNENIRWEDTRELNLGLDFGFFRNRLKGSIDVYNRKTSDALIPGIFPQESGAQDYTENLADVTNKGYEIDIFGDLLTNEDLIWSLGFNISKNINTLDRFNAAGLGFLTTFSEIYEIGRETNIIRGYVVEGIFQTQQEIDALNAGASDGFYQEIGTAPGDYKYVDLNGDGKITSADQKYLGSAQPDFFGGFNTSITYKNFNLSANFNYSVGGESRLVFNDLAAFLNFPEQNVETRFLDFWTPNNRSARYPRAILADPNNNNRSSSALVYDTSYLRLQSLQLRYNMPETVLSSLGLSRVSISLTGNNLWTKTDFPGIDPSGTEGLASRNNTNSSNPYPIAKSWALGLNVNF